MSNPMLKQRLEEYTEQEFLRFLQEICEDTETNHMPDEQWDSYMSELVQHFIRVTGHPSGSDLIFWPKPGQDDSPEGILREVKRWRAKQGLPGFKAK